MSKKTMVKFCVFIAICAFGPMILYGCSSEIAKYEGKIKAQIISYDFYEKTIVVSFMLGDTQLFDELKEMKNKFFAIIQNQEEVTFTVDITSKSGG